MLKSSNSISDFKEPSPFSSREIEIKKYKKSSAFFDWVQTNFKFRSSGNSYSNSNKNKNIIQKISKCMIYFHRYTSSLQHFTISDLSHIYFWTDPSTIASENINLIINNINNQYSINYPGITVNAYIDDSFTTFSKSFSIRRAQTFPPRMIFHYIGPYISTDPIDSISFFSKPQSNPISISNILPSLGDSCSIIIDRDRAGLLKTPILNYYQSRQSSNFVAFFSCLNDQIMPSSSNFPKDIFTSCLTTPARISLLYHSRNYYCFKDGPLFPLSTYFIDQYTEKERIKVDNLLKEICQTLTCIVEALAIKSMDKQRFLLLFRSDQYLSTLCVNFVLSCRILGGFGITPTSFPLIPDFSNAPEWHILDLRLDAALFNLFSPQPQNTLTYHYFLEQTLKSLENIFSLPDPQNHFPLELGFLPVILFDKSICLRACDLLSKILDLSDLVVDRLVQLPILSSLFTVLSEGIISKSLLFCIIKVISSNFDLKSSILDLIPHTVESVFENIIDNSNDLLEIKLILILLVVLYKDSTLPFRSIRLLTHPKVIKFPIWNLLLIKSVVPVISDTKTLSNLLDFLLNFEISDKVEINLCLIHSLSSFIRGDAMLGLRKMNPEDMKFRRNFEKKSALHALKFSNHLSHIIRYELLVFTYKFIRSHLTQFHESQKEIYIKIRNFFSDCLCDPHPEISTTATSLEISFNNNNNVNNDIELKSYVIDEYINRLIHPILTSFNSNEESFPNPKNEFLIKKEKMIIIHNVSPNKLPDLNWNPRNKYNLIHKSNYIITSNFETVNDFIYFGDKKGTLTRFEWFSNDHIKQASIFNDSITSIKYSNNNSYPLLITATSKGHCYIHNIDINMNPSITTAFRINNDLKSSNYYLELNKWNLNMYSHSNLNNYFEVFDLRSCQKLNPIPAPDDRAICIKSLDKYTDYVAVAGNNFSILDLRIPNFKPVIEVPCEPSVFSFEILDDNIPSFAICTQDNSVAICDSRYPDGLRTVKIFVPDNIPDQTICFSSHSISLSALIGHKEGMTYVSLSNNMQKTLPNIPISFASSKPPKPYQVCFHPKKSALFFANDNLELYTLT